MVALSLTALVGVTALVVDLGYLYVVRNEVQNAADSAALTGASNLYTTTGIDWNNAETKARNEIGWNSAATVALEEGDVQTGYWNIGRNPDYLQAKNITPGTGDMPAVRVTINKNSASSNGPISTFFAGIWGKSTLDTGATAIAVVSSPGKAGTGVLFPVAITKCMYDNYWDSTTGQPTSPNSPFNITSPYHTGPCEAGQWTSLLTDNNDVQTIRGLIDNGNPDPLGIGDDIWIEPGTKNALYDDVNNCSAAGNGSCEYVMVAVVDDISTHAEVPVVAFACLRILSAYGGNEKRITVQMVGMGDPHCTFSGTSSTGPAYGVTQPPRLSY